MGEQISLSALGGSGENGRNCFLIEAGEGLFLLDCGVKRDIRDGEVGFYPALTRELAARIRAVFVSHCHEDHSAALPLLYELGYRGKVYASAETAALIPDFVSKWMNFVERNGGKLPFSPEQARNIRFEELPPGESTVEGISVKTGRSGHVLGGIWFHFDLGQKRVFYSGDMVWEPALLAVDPPPPADAAVLNAGYAGKLFNSGEQYAALHASIDETLCAGGMVLLPLPAVGRGSDLYFHLSGYLRDVPLFVEQNILNSYRELLTKKEWLKPQALAPPGPGARLIPVENQAQRENAWANKTGVYLAGDGMLSTKDSQFSYEKIRGQKESRIIITGHAADGTIAAGVIDPRYRAENNVSCNAGKIIFKAHLDDNDVLAVQNRVKAKTIILFHAEKKSCDSPIALLKDAGADAHCVLWPNKIPV